MRYCPYCMREIEGSWCPDCQKDAETAKNLMKFIENEEKKKKEQN